LSQATVRPSTHKPNATPEHFGRHLIGLEQLYASMDRSYKYTADRYGFACNGCEDSCCLTLFHHHTHLEFLYLSKGFRALDRQRQMAIAEKAEAVCSAVRTSEKNGPPPRQMCPLNVDNRCSLYAFRPMICRLHGIPSELHRPDGKTTRAPGCASFMDCCGRLAYVPFDRTTFYRDLAGIEQALRRDMPGAGKIKMTVAEMILAF
jgi:Fe-S-cluster containining protein